ncbi:MAG: ParB N-terminal domain-containing protein [Treponemataceae bacterium]|nr:ParB N-terminal domain-containing protein [Treponemataceae bacterium]
MQVLIKDIKIKKRVRKDMGNLDDLKTSLSRYGLLNPITINSDNYLVAGHRRLQAAKALGWDSIEAVVVDSHDKLTLLELELEENNQRKAFTDMELLDGYKELEKLRNPGFFAKLFNKIAAFFQKHFDQRNERIAGRRIRNGFLSILVLLGLGIIVAGSILYKHSFITLPLHTIMDILGFIVFVFGSFFFAKFLIGFKR